MKRRILTNKEYDLLNRVCGLTDKGLAKVAYRIFVKTYGKNKTTMTNDYVYAQGKLPVLLVAHLDTVWNYNEKPFVYDRVKNIVMGEQEPCGFDDRAGVAAIFTLIQKGYRPSVLLCFDEEVGGLGATQAAIDLKDRIDVKYMIELDRRGENDCVFYSDDNREFVEYVETYGFKENYGSFSDISELMPSFGISACNLSIGYLAEHTPAERLCVDWYFQTIDKVSNMLNDSFDAPFFKYCGTPSYFSRMPIPYKYEGTTAVECQHCHKWVDIDDTLPTVCENDQIGYTCYDCIPRAVRFCDACGNVFKPEVVENNKCPYCGSRMEDVSYGE